MVCVNSDWRAAWDKNGHSELFEIIRKYTTVKPRIEASSEARRFAEALLHPYTVGQPRQDAECPYLEVVDLVQQEFSLPRRSAYNTVNRAREYLGIPMSKE